MIRAICALLVIATAVAHADSEQAFRDALARGDVDALEAVGNGPASKWTDNAWREASRLAEKAGDYARARTDLGKAIAADDDDVQRTRDRADLARVTARTGGGTWDAIIAEQERLESQILGGADPRPAIDALGKLIAASPDYPRRVDLRIALAAGLERDGSGDDAIAALQEAMRTAPSRAEAIRAQVALVRALIRGGALDDADRELRGLSGEGDSGGPGTDRTLVDPATIAELTDALATARRRHALRVGLWVLLAVIAAGAIAVARRDAGSWRAMLRRLVRPPAEVAFFVPIAAVLAIVASTGNPLVARAVRGIAIGGTIVAWVSGALLDGAKPLRRRRVAVHALVAAIAVAAAAYLAIDRDRMLDLVTETWREGPQRR